MRYDKAARKKSPDWVLGMLYIVDVRMVIRSSGEKVKHKILLVGCEADDIERKLRWSFDMKKYSEFSITGIEKVKEKIHVLTTIITQERASPDAVIERNEGTQNIQQAAPIPDILSLFAVGLATTIPAVDEDHAIRKVGHALIALATDKSHAGAKLSENAVLTVEPISRSSGFALPRDVSQEINKAHMVRG